jgi:rhodanese-related sulfurtransferase
MNKRVFFLVFIFNLLFVFLVALNSSLAQEPKKILSIEAYDMLNTVPDTFIIDVRTRAEYQFVGHPVGAYLFPYMLMTDNFVKENDQWGYQFDVKNTAFVTEISKVFQQSNNLLIICRDGMRSAPAAKELANAGFKNVFDVGDGFEGAEFPSFEDANSNKFYRQLARRNKIYGLNQRRHSGWQWWGLPWTYEIDPKNIYPPDLAPSKK